MGSPSRARGPAVDGAGTRMNLLIRRVTTKATRGISPLRDAVDAGFGGDLGLRGSAPVPIPLAGSRLTSCMGGSRSGRIMDVGPKRQRAPAFNEVVAKSRADVSRHPRDGQSSNRVTDEGAWDADGKYWPAANHYLSRVEVEALLDAPGLAVAIHGGYGRPVRFLGPGETRRVWAVEVRDHFADEGDLGSGGWPDHVAYLAELRQRPDGSRLLWFGGQC
jgi:hypothetical protein